MNKDTFIVIRRDNMETEAGKPVWSQESSRDVPMVSNPNVDLSGHKIPVYL